MNISTIKSAYLRVLQENVCYDTAELKDNIHHDSAKQKPGFVIINQNIAILWASSVDKLEQYRT